MSHFPKATLCVSFYYNSKKVCPKLFYKKFLVSTLVPKMKTPSWFKFPNKLTKHVNNFNEIAYFIINLNVAFGDKCNGGV